MVRNMAIARDLGYLNVPARVLVDAKDLADLPPERQVLISTGSQGEPLSALSRIAQRNHNFVHIEEGDTVVLASSLIPGNENAVYRVINGLSRWGANVVHKGNALVHVSGHASAGELLYCYNIVQPAQRAAGPRRDPAHAGQRRAGPVHRRPHENVVIAEDGVVVDLVDGVARIAGKVDCGYVFVDGSSIGDITETVPQGPADPRRGGLHLGDRGDRLGQREGLRRPGDPCPRASPRTTRPSTRSSSRSSTRSTRRSARASTTPTSSSRRYAGSSAAGSTAPTAAAR